MKYYISRFLNSNDIKSRYVLVDLFFISDDDTEIKIGDTLYLDRMDKFDVKSFNFIILYSFLNQNINEKIVKIVFKFNELSKNQYIKNKIIKVKIFTIHDSVDCCVGLIPRDVIVSSKSRRRIRSGLIERH